MSGTLKDFYIFNYKKVLNESKVWTHEYECSAVGVYRLFYQEVFPLKNGEGIIVVNSLRTEKYIQNINALELTNLKLEYTDLNGMITQCSNCRKIQRIHEKEIWDWVPIDTSPINKTVNYLFNRSVIQQFGYSTYSENPGAFNKYADAKDFGVKYVISDEQFSKFVKYALAHDPDKGVTEAEIRAARTKVEIGIKAFIARQKWGNNGYYSFINQIDDTYLVALKKFGVE